MIIIIIIIIQPHPNPNGPGLQVPLFQPSFDIPTAQGSPSKDAPPATYAMVEATLEASDQSERALSHPDVQALS